MRFSNKFKMTPRRKQILWYLAFTDEIQFPLDRDFSTYGHERKMYPKPRLFDVGIYAIMVVLARERLIKYRKGSPTAHITVKGIESILSGSQ